MRRNKTDLLLAELRDLVFRLCAAGGATLGLLAGFERPPAKAPDCPRSDPCVAETIGAGMERILVPAGAGLLIGMIVGFFLAQLLRRRSSAAERGRLITARFAGSCRECGLGLVPGDRVLHFRQARAIACESCGRS